MFLRKKNKQTACPTESFRRGFTLVELLVTISIFVILTGVVLFNQSRFNSTILLTNLAYDTALTIRQAQTYGINIKEFNDGKFVPYGVHFTTSSNKSFILFADSNFNLDNQSLSPYTGDVNTCNTNVGCVNRYTIKRGNYISKLEVEKGGATSSVNTLDIMFRRPNPDAVIISSDNYEYTKATIYLSGVDGNTRKVNVQANGLIEIVQ